MALVWPKTACDSRGEAEYVCNTKLSVSLSLRGLVASFEI